MKTNPSNPTIQKSPLTFIPCTEHPGSSYNRVDPDPSSSKHIYCHECLFQYENPTSRYKTFPNLLEFLTNAVTTFEKNKPMIKSFNKPEEAYLDVLTNKKEILHRFTEYFNEQKAKIEMLVAELEKGIQEEL